MAFLRYAEGTSWSRLEKPVWFPCRGRDGSFSAQCPYTCPAPGQFYDAVANQIECVSSQGTIPSFPCRLQFSFIPPMTSTLFENRNSHNQHITIVTIPKRKPVAKVWPHSQIYRSFDQQNYCVGMFSANKNRHPERKISSPFPFSSYIVKSYSSDPPEVLKVNAYKKSVAIQNEMYQFCNEKQVETTNNKLFLLEQLVKSRQNGPNGQPVQESGVYQSQIKPRVAYRIRGQAQIKVKTVSPSKRVKLSDNRSLQAACRYHIISLYSLLNKRDDYFNSLRQNKADFITPPLKSDEIEDRLDKMLHSKGKDRGRQKFNHLTNEQLRSLKYKSKPLPQISPKKEEANRQGDDTEEDDDQPAQKATEVQTLDAWKRKYGCRNNQKVFIIKGGYGQLRKSLVERGWFENYDVWSNFYDFKWTTRICDIDYIGLKSGQCTNHFNNNHHLTSKYGLTRRLRTLILGHQIDSDQFYPRCYDLGDQVEFQNFVENFKLGFAESVIRRFLVDKDRYKGRELKIRTGFDILKRRCQQFQQKIQNINKGVFPTITSEEWEILTETGEHDPETLKDKLKECRKGEKLDAEDDHYESQLYSDLDKKVTALLAAHKKSDPQIEINGWRNVWIAKPNFMSRGRGIRCFNNLYDIADYCLGRECQFVVQKYIENPLLIEGRKFDIRQWVLIQDYNPPKIWFYDECYLRFCVDDYSLDNIYNRHLHLTNLSVQRDKYKKNQSLEKSMWEMQELADHIGQDKWHLIQEKIKNIVVWSIKSCEGHVLAKKGSCELVGYDFMIDENLNPWLIEINMSPSMEASTPVTKRLVKNLLEDTAKVLAGSKKAKTAGSFSCIYRSPEDLDKYDIYKI